MPESIEDPAPTPAPTQATIKDPAIAESIDIPSVDDADDTEGGEWNLLVEKARQWVKDLNLQTLWDRWRVPLKVGSGLIALILLLQVYGGIIRTIDSLPLASGLLELAGLIWVVNFSMRNMIRSSDRQQILDGLRARWTSITGR